MISEALREIMDAVDDLTTADDALVRNTKRSFIALRVARLTGDELQQVFDALRDPPSRALKVPSHQRAVKAPKETLDQVVADLAEKIRVVPVNTEVGGGEVPWGEEPC